MSVDAAGLPVFKYTTIERRLSAICRWHADNGLPSPRSLQISQTLARIQHARKQSGETRRKAAPITTDHLRGLIDVMWSVTGERGVLERAMVLVGWACALRRSELVALDLDDVGVMGDGRIQITIRRSKEDQLAQGVVLSLVPELGALKLCPVAALREWLSIRQPSVSSRALFWKPCWNRVTVGRRACAWQFSNTVKEWVSSAGLSPGPGGMTYSSHSLRAGFITSAVNASKPAPSVMARTRHSTVSGLFDYVRNAPVEREPGATVPGALLNETSRLLEAFGRATRNLLDEVGETELRAAFEAIVVERRNQEGSKN